MRIALDLTIRSVATLVLLAAMLFAASALSPAPLASAAPAPAPAEGRQCTTTVILSPGQTTEVYSAANLALAQQTKDLNRKQQLQTPLYTVSYTYWNGTHYLLINGGWYYMPLYSHRHGPLTFTRPAFSVQSVSVTADCAYAFSQPR